MVDGPPPPPLDHRPVLHHDTQEVAHIKEYTYTHGRWTPLQSTRDLWNTTTPKSFT